MIPSLAPDDAPSDAIYDSNESSLDTLRLVWWNTSLSPPGASTRTTHEHLTFVLRQLSQMQAAFGWDILGLGEVNQSDIDAILSGLANPSLSIAPMDATKNPANDVALLYDREKLIYLDDKSLRDMHGNRTLKSGHLVRFESVATSEIFHVVVLHWPGRLFMHEAAPARGHLGMSLHRSLQNLLDQNCNVIVMGDFNDDPPSQSLAHNLFATRDRTLAIEQSHFLYNPFWRRIGESHPAGHSLGVCGTHYYAGGTDSRWFTYDQILFSRSFLGAGKYSLHEPASQILALPELTAELLSRNSIYDHYPVTSAVSSREKR